jgi:uncharacterized MnhB-related membrane protein
VTTTAMHGVEDTRESANSRILRYLNLTGWLLVGAVGLFMLARTSTFAYSSDSWSYVDIARGIWEPQREFGSVQGLRNYVNTPWVNDSFPFAWPLLLAPGVALFGPQAAVGGYLAVAIWVATVAIVSLTLRALRGAMFLGPVTGLALLALPGYADEVHAGRSIPLSIFLLSTAIFVLASRPGKHQYVAPLLIGIALGLCAATRFDALAYGPIFIALAFAFGFFRFRDALIASAGWLAFPMAWSVYSQIRLGGPYATDNSRVFWSPMKAWVTDWPTLDAAPSGITGVLGKMLGNTGQATQGFASAFGPIVIPAVVLSVIALVALLALLALHTKLRPAPDLALTGPKAKPEEATRLPLFLATLSCSMMFITAVLMTGTGYFDARYWGAAGAVLLIAISVAATPFISDRSARGEARAIIKLGVQTLSTVFLSVAAVIGVVTTQTEFQSTGSQTAADTLQIDCLSGLGTDTFIATIDPFRIPATARFRVATPPANYAELSTADWAKLSEDYGIDKWILNEARYPFPAAAVGVFEPVSCG